MAAFTVLVTGVPGSGKTTLARELSVRLHPPLLSMDTIKEQLFTTLGVGDRAWALQLRTASLAVIWSLLPDCPTAPSLICGSTLNETEGSRSPG